MDKLVTVLTAAYPQDLWVLKTRLESEDITCFLKDELTVQSYALYSNAIGGVKLQVWEEDAERATALLTELGYIKEEHDETDILNRAIKFTAVIPLINRLPGLWRISVLAVLIVAVLATALFFILKPGKYETLTSTTWDITSMYYKNKPVTPNSIGMVVLMGGSETPREQLWFRHSGEVDLPGINSYPVGGGWKLNDDGTVTINATAFKNIYSGTYNLDMTGRSLALKSATTVIYAERDY